MLGCAAVDALVNGKAGHMVGEINKDIAHTPLKDTWEEKKELDDDLKELVKLLAH